MVESTTDLNLRVCMLKVSAWLLHKWYFEYRDYSIDLNYVCSLYAMSLISYVLHTDSYVSQPLRELELAK